MGLRKITTSVFLSVLAACGAAPEQLADHSDAITALPPDAPQNLSAAQLRVERSMIVTDAAALAHFPLRRVMNTIAASEPETTTNGTRLFRKLWAAQRARGGNDADRLFFCDDVGGALGDQSVTCPRAEASLENDAPDAFIPTALVNRFDLAPTNGANCGEYRIVYAMPRAPFSFGRNFMIFEAVLPNPNPSRGLEGCRPVANFWARQSRINNANTRANRLRRFYYSGIDGFEPVIERTHYGLRRTYELPNGRRRARRWGQIRTNEFIQAPWMLREFKLNVSCDSASCDLLAQPVRTVDTPQIDLWDGSDAQYNADFVDKIGRLLPADNRPESLSLVSSGRYDMAEDDVVGKSYSPSGALRSAINAALRERGSGLNANQIGRRVQTQTCAGCHQLSNGVALGGGMGSWPSSLGFVHIDENSRLSSALTTVFIPHRQGVLADYLASGVTVAASEDRSLGGATTH
ncbi:MAG: hypothetical protein RIT81_22100 [Deltaproteobacteria bacterium]